MLARTYTITTDDIGKRFIRLTGKIYILSSSIGYVQAQDVGKILVIKNNVISMRSN